MSNPKAITKAEFAQMLGVHPNTLRRWINNYYIIILVSEYNYRKTQRFFTAPQYHYLKSELCA